MSATDKLACENLSFIYSRSPTQIELEPQERLGALNFGFIL